MTKILELLPALLVVLTAAAALGSDVRALITRTPGATLPAHLRTWALVSDPERRTRLVWAARVLYAAVTVYLLHRGVVAP
jgi:hypothetical protein